MKTVILACLIASAAAFVPAGQTDRTTLALHADLTKEIGAQAPLGFFDPTQSLGADPTNGDQADFDRRRWVELKHGRIAMLAVVGYLSTYVGYRFPGAEDLPCGFANLAEVPGMVWAQMIATWGMMEAANQDQSQAPWGTDAGAQNFKAEFIGDFRNGALDFGWDERSDAWKRKKRTIELNNGRAAMMGITGLMVHDIMGNVDQLLPDWIQKY
ncbi:Fucoxanthin-chlorophyll a-c binding protein [Seminavis robusta]|uniref:Fucoxanthin-chlorophyll a-c binding protein n=1 Tax=Seminavis robusta TaxID=568900 RepID=A0A9N8DTG0_9STRA|nr:Fucoxanthin-chlorophyll a-c binding protein [Seminavis robusta]|eukprot:Sro267_g103540.1 Fucoxanthin-chlorophyll a-c binding protein (213) ;mRNA; f:70759-71498